MSFVIISLIQTCALDDTKKYYFHILFLCIAVGNYNSIVSYSAVLLTTNVKACSDIYVRFGLVNLLSIIGEGNCGEI